MTLGPILSECAEFGKTLGWYASKKGTIVASHLEGAKSIVVEVLKARRGTYQKPFLHVGMVLLTITAFGVAPLLVQQYPASAFSENSSSPFSESSLPGEQDITNIDTITEESEKPRRDVEEYTVQGGDTLSSIAEKYKVDVASIAYLNGFSTGRILRPGDKVKIPPVSGIILTVKPGDTIYSLAKKYGLPTAQSIVDWDYNTFVDDERFTLAAGQTLVIPGGRPPQEAPIIPKSTPKPSLLSGGVAGSGQFAWPTNGVITQYFTGYHTGDDIANSVGTSVTAADGGRVVSVLYQNYGYGYHVIIDHGNGLQSLYAHLSRIVVSVGDNVSRGQLVGLMGSTGRSTGPHLHFEIRRNGGFQNPLNYLR